MSEQQIIDLINQWIVANGNNEITADVLRPILLAMVEQPNDLIGNLSELTTSETDNLVNAINSIVSAIESEYSNNVKVWSGQANPNTTPPPEYSDADFYIQQDIEGAPIALWQFDGNVWRNRTQSMPNGFTQLGSVTRIGTEVTVNPEFRWVIAETLNQRPDTVSFLIETEGTNESRVDAIYTTLGSQIAIRQGLPAEGSNIAVPPAIDPNTELLLTYIYVYEDNISDPENPFIGELYVEKKESASFNVFESGDLETIVLSGIQSRVEVIGDEFNGVESIGSMSRNGTNYKEYPGKLLNILNDNLNDGDLKIYHDNVNPDNVFIPFFIPGLLAGEFLTVPKGFLAQFYYKSGYFYYNKFVGIGGGSTGVQSVTGTMVDNTDPLNPIIESDETKADLVTGNVPTNQLANVLAVLLTGVSAISGVIVSTDTILQAFGKVKNALSVLTADVALRQLISNIAQDFSAPSTTTYPSTQAVFNMNRRRTFFLYGPDFSAIGAASNNFYYKFAAGTTYAFTTDALTTDHTLLSPITSGGYQFKVPFKCKLTDLSMITNITPAAGFQSAISIWGRTSDGLNNTEYIYGTKATSGTFLFADLTTNIIIPAGSIMKIFVKNGASTGQPGGHLNLTFDEEF